MARLLTSRASHAAARRRVPAFVTARRFTGDASLSAADSASLQTPTTAITVAGWVKFPVAGAWGDSYGALLMKQWGTVLPFLSYAVQHAPTANTGEFRFRIADGTTNYNTELTTALPTQAWIYLAGTWTSGSVMTLRQWNAAGTLQQTVTSVGSVSATIAYTADPLVVGSDAQAPNGVSADMAGWIVDDAVLTDGELATHRAGEFPVVASAGAWRLGVGDPDTDAAQGNDLAVVGQGSIVVSGPDDTTSPIVSDVATAGIGDTFATVTWNTSESSQSQVDYGLTASYGTSATETQLVTAHSVQITGLTAATEYHYRVVAADTAGNTAQTGDLTFTTAAAQVPDAPTGLSASPGDGEVSLSWAAVSGADTYTVYRSTTSGSGFSSIQSGLTSPSHNDTTAVNDTTYYYKVTATNTTGESADSSEQSATPTAAGVAGTWQQMRDSLVLSSGQEAANTVKIEDYYEATTGHLAAPDGDPGTLLAIGSVLIDAAWLSANEDGTHIYQSGGRWYIDGCSGSSFRVNIDDLTIRRCSVNRGSSTIADAVSYSTNNSGLIVEYCTLSGGTPNGSEGKGVEAIAGTSGVTASIVRHCKISHFRAGIYCYGDGTFHHNWVTESYYFSGSHNSSLSCRGPFTIITRNYLTTGNSAALTIYADLSPITDLLVDENIFRTDIASYGITFAASKQYFDQSGADNFLTDNLFYKTPGDNPNFPPAYQYQTGGAWEAQTGNQYIDGTAI